eukprot:1852265-Prymnesium_polylepis.1
MRACKSVKTRLLRHDGCIVPMSACRSVRDAGPQRARRYAMLQSLQRRWRHFAIYFFHPPRRERDQLTVHGRWPMLSPEA